MKKSVAVLGLGKFGSSIARSLAKGGAEVLAVDKDEDLVRDIADKVTCAVCVDISDKEMMNNIGLEGMDAVVIATAEHLDSSVMALMIVKEIGVPYVLAKADGTLKGEPKALFVAIGINNTGHKEVLGFEVYDSEKVNTWRDFFENLKSRGLRGVDIVISDAHAGLVEAIKESFSGSSWQRCQAHFTRNIIDKCPKKYSTGLASELRDMFNAATIEEARRLKESIYDEYQDVANEAMTVLDEGFEDSITIMALPSKYRIALRTSNIIERENREIRRREKVIQIFPNTESIIRLIGAVLQDDHNEWSVGHKIFDMKEYYDKLSSIQSNLLKIKVA